MEIRKLNCIYYSPTGNARKVLSELASVFDNEAAYFDLMKGAVSEPTEFSSDELIIIAIPVHEGRVPTHCLDSLCNLYGNGTPAIAVCVYGNRAYDDALIELCDILGDNGICVIGAAAFATEHNILHRLGHKRPDEEDIAEIHSFAVKCRDKLSDGESYEFSPVHVRGERPYRLIQGNYSLVPTGDEHCLHCEICYNICPVGAIDIAHPERTDPEKCVTCMACTAVCPIRCRMPRDPALPDVLGFLIDLVDTRAPNETFLD